MHDLTARELAVVIGLCAALGIASAAVAALGEPFTSDPRFFLGLAILAGGSVCGLLGLSAVRGRISEHWEEDAAPTLH